jgi:hypothetical protein
MDRLYETVVKPRMARKAIKGFLSAEKERLKREKERKSRGLANERCRGARIAIWKSWFLTLKKEICLVVSCYD